jgi:predicted ribosomally synthesized peptide with nif11-like leader
VVEVVVVASPSFMPTEVETLMSKENLQLFIEKVTESDELQALIGDEIYIKSLIALGAEYGYEFSGEDLMENIEFSGEELDGVAEGGLQV